MMAQIVDSHRGRGEHAGIGRLRPPFALGNPDLRPTQIDTSIGGNVGIVLDCGRVQLATKGNAATIEFITHKGAKRNPFLLCASNKLPSQLRLGEKRPLLGDAGPFTQRRMVVIKPRFRQEEFAIDPATQPVLGQCQKDADLTHIDLA